MRTYNKLPKVGNYTPGPWVSKPTASLGPQYVVHPESDGPDIAIVYDHGNAEGNARLIAAAPDLLESCKQFLECGRAGLDTSWYSDAVQDVFYKMMRAVDCAEMGQP